ncbi:MAG: NAD(P)-dependent oxidoreductase [Cyclobacteriaceae bacterium]
MKILLLGATGRTGKLILQQALKREHTVIALVRDPSKVSVKDPNLSLLSGTPANPSDLERCFKSETIDTVISALNISRTSDFPWASLRAPKNFLSQVMTNLLPLMDDHHVRRLVVMSAWGVGKSRKYLPAWFRWIIDNTNVGAAYTDHEVQEHLIAESQLDWTIIRPVGLTNSSKSKPIKVCLDSEQKLSLTISRKDVAQFVLEAAESGGYIKQRPGISN